MRDLEVRHCRVLVALADFGGVAAAARALQLSQSTVSETILALERLTGVQILVRQAGKGAQLTAAAEALLPHARSIISASHAALSSISLGGRRTIKLGAIESMSSYLLPQAIASVRAHYDAVDVQVTTGICHTLRQLVQRGELDAAITLESPPSGRDSQQRTTFVAEARLTFLGREPSYRSLTKASLAGRTILLPDPEGAVKQLVEQWFASANLEVRLESAGSVDGVKRGVQAGNAVGVLPTYSIVEEVQSATLFALEIADNFPCVRVELTAQPRMHDDPMLQMLIGVTAAELARLS